jgi:8-oxo-dGTP pyrophosphatase MutT (NUDIX family)
MGGAHVFPGGSVDPEDRLDPCAVSDPARMADVDAATAIAYYAAAVRELHEEAGVRVAPDALAYFAHWVTPEIEIKRFDARFFAAVLPPGQEAAYADGESSGGAWFDPADAVARCRAGEIALPPPTWTTLRVLERFSSVDAVMAWARTCQVSRIQPEFVKRGDTAMLLLHEDFPETRFVLDRGRWRAIEDT